MTLAPFQVSIMSGYRVPRKTVAAATRKNKLLKRNTDSRETMESISIWLFSLWALSIKDPKARPMIMVTKIRM